MRRRIETAEQLSARLKHEAKSRRPLVAFMAQLALCEPFVFPQDSETPAVTTWSYAYPSSTGMHTFTQEITRTIERRTDLGQVQVHAGFEEVNMDGRFSRRFKYIVGTKTAYMEGTAAAITPGANYSLEAFNDEDVLELPKKLLRGIAAGNLQHEEPLSVQMLRVQLALKGGQSEGMREHLQTLIDFENVIYGQGFENH